MAMGGDDDDGSMLSEINVTPLVDVMLVLLIIFMVTAPMIEQGVDIDLPKAEAKTLDPDEKKLVLFIDDQRRIFLGQTFIPFSVLQAKLQHNEKLKAEKELYLKADQGLPYGLVVKVMAIAKNAGIDRVNMITEGAPGKLRGAESEAGYTMEETSPNAVKKKAKTKKERAAP